MATNSPASTSIHQQSSTASQLLGRGGAVEMETQNHVMQEESSPAAAAMTVATAKHASVEQPNEQQHQHVANGDNANSLLNHNNNASDSTRNEKDERNVMITTATMTATTLGFPKNSSKHHKVVRVKKKTAHRTSLNEFFQKAAMVAAARLERQRPATRHNGRRENTNSVFTSTGSLITTMQKQQSGGGGESASSSVKSRDGSGIGGGGSRCSSSNGRKRKSNGTAETQGSKKRKQTAPQPSSHANNQLDHPEAAWQPIEENNSTPGYVHVVTAASLAAKTRDEYVELPYRPDGTEESDFPVIPLPRAIDVIFGRGSRVAKHHGNILFRGIVRNNKKRYLSSNTRRSDKNLIAQEVVDMVVQTGGRFLELAEDHGGSVLTGPWRHASYAKCVEKTCQALREQKWNDGSPSPSPTGTASLIPVEDPESIPPPPPPPSAARALRPAEHVDTAEESTTPTRSRAPPLKAKTGTPTSHIGAVATHKDSSSSESNPSKTNTTTRREGPGSVASIKEHHTQAGANEEILDIDPRTVEEQMSRLQEGSRVAIYWPLDAAYYEGTIEDRLQDNFFYVRYDDEESEWLDLYKHAFKVLSAPVPVPPRAPVALPLEAARATTKVAAKKKSSNKKESSRDKKETSKKKEASHGKKETSNKKESNKTKDSSNKKESSTKKESSNEQESSIKKKNPGGKKKAKKAPVIRSSAQRSKQILDSIAKHGLNDWELVASEVPDWSAEDCRRRYELYLDPSLSKKPFTEAELREIMLLQSEHGNDWASIAPKLTIPRSCVFLSDKWNRKIRNIILRNLSSHGLTRKQMDGNDKKRIDYHGHFEEVLAEVAAAQI